MEIIILLLLIVLNGIFSMSEIALVSSRKARLEASAKKGNKNAKAALNLANAPNKFLSTVQIGITLIGILTGIYSGENITNDLQAFLERYEWLRPYAGSVAVTIVLIGVTYVSLVLGELVPKRIGLANPEGISKAVARPMRILSLCVAPFVWLLTFTSDLILKVLNIKSSTQGNVTEEEIKAIIQEGTEGGEVQEIEQNIVERVFNLGDRKISSLMNYRSDIVYLDINTDKETLRSQVIQDLHSVYPVIDRKPDEVMGVVYLKDLFAHIADPGFDLKSFTKPAHFLNENMSAYKTLERFKEVRIHYGIVVDEFGATQGIVTMNDILEALVGDTAEFYVDGYQITQRDDGSFLVDGQYPFYDFLNYFDLTELAEENEYNTISGLILDKLGHIPATGERLQWNVMEMEIIDMDGARIDKLLVRKKES